MGKDRPLRVAVYVPRCFMYGHYADIEVVAERMGLDPVNRQMSIRHHIDGYFLAPEQARDAKYAGATEVTRIEMDRFFHPDDFR